MDNDIIFECPSCGAPVPAKDTDRMARCEYCGNHLAVPAELRAAPPTQYAPVQRSVVINLGGTEMGDTIFQTNTPSYSRARRRTGCGGVLATLFILAITFGSVGAVAWAVIEQVNPGFVKQLFGGGFAKRGISFGGNGQGPGFFSNAVAIAVGTAGDIYVAERSSGRVQRFNKAGVYLNGWVVDDKDIVAVTANRETGDLYVVTNTEVYRYDAISGAILGTLIHDSKGFFSTGDVALFPNGDLLTFVSGVSGASGIAGASDDLVRNDRFGGELQRFPSAVSKVYGAVQPPLPWQVRLAVDSTGNMLVLSKLFDPGAEVLIYDSEGQYITRFAGGGSGNERFSFPSDIAVDSKGRIYVGDSKGIQVFDRKGVYVDRIALPLGQTALGMDTTEDDRLIVITSSEEVIEFIPK